jgi:hypothetical protein
VWILCVSNFNQNFQEVWEVRSELHLALWVKRDCHLADYRNPRLLDGFFVRNFCTESACWIQSSLSLNTCFFIIHFSIIVPFTLRLHSWSLIFKFSDQNFLWISRLPVSAPCPTCLIVLHCITLIISGEEYKLHGSLLGSFFFHRSVRFSILSPVILRSSLFADTLQVFIFS